MHRPHYVSPNSFVDSWDGLAFTQNMGKIEGKKLFHETFIYDYKIGSFILLHRT